MGLFALYIIFTMSALVFMKIGGQQFQFNITDGLINLTLGFKLILAMFMYGTSFILWTIIVNKNELSFILPVSTTVTNVLSIVLGVIIFQESLSANKIIGIIIATIGIAVMVYK